MKKGRGIGLVRSAGSAEDVTTMTDERQLGDVLLALSDEVFNAIRSPIAMLDGELRVAFANEAFYRAFDVAPEQTLGQQLIGDADGPLRAPSLSRLLTLLNDQASEGEDSEVLLDAVASDQRRFLVSARRLHGTLPCGQQILLCFEEAAEPQGTEQADAAIADGWKGKSRIIMASVQGLHESLRTLGRLQHLLAHNPDSTVTQETADRADGIIGRMSRTLSTLRDILVTKDAVPPMIEGGVPPTPGPPAVLDRALKRAWRAGGTDQVKPSGKSPMRTAATTVGHGSGRALVVVADGESGPQLANLLQDGGWQIEFLTEPEALLVRVRNSPNIRVVMDGRQSAAAGLDLLKGLRQIGYGASAVVLINRAESALAVALARLAPVDLVMEPIDGRELLAAVRRAWLSAPIDLTNQYEASAEVRLSRLTQQERRVVNLVIAGHPNKKIAALLRISQRTVEHHRQSAMRKVGARSVYDLVRLVMIDAANQVPT